MKRSTEVRRYIEGLTCPRGYGAGLPFKVLPWQSRFLALVCDDRPRISLLSIPRGNGKSTFAGAIAAAIIGGPLAVENAESLVVAHTMDGAGQIFNVCKFALGMGGRKRAARFRYRQESNYQEIENIETGGVLKIAASNATSIMGSGFAFALCDELAFWKRGAAAWNTLKTSMGKIPGAQIIGLGTRPLEDRTDFYNKALEAAREDGAAMIYDYTGPAPFTLAAVRQANPSFRYFPPLQDEIKAELKEARRDADAGAAFKAFRLNDGSAYDANKAEAGLINLEDWQSVCETPRPYLPAPSGPYVLGLDLGGAASWTAAAAYWPQTGLLLAKAFMPSTPSVSAAARRDSIPLELYRKLISDGDLMIEGNRTVCPAAVLDWTRAAWGNPAAIITDRYRDNETREALDVSEAAAPLVVRGTGFKSADEDTRAFQTYALDGRIKAPRSALFRLALGDTLLKRDPSGAQKIDKARRYAKNDPIAAAVLAVSHAKRNPLKAPRYGGRVWIGGKAV